MVSTPVANALAVLALFLIPFIWGDFTAYQLGLYLLYGMVGQGIALCWGRAGFLPLGQALFFGIGAYLSGHALQGSASWSAVLVGFAAAIVIPGLLAWIVGVLAFDRQVGSGPYFSLITLALSMLGYQLANSMDALTGGFNGLTGIAGLPGIDTYSRLYFVIVIALALSTFLIGQVYRLPFGQLLDGVRENEDRMQLFGFRSSRLKALAFGFSGAVAGLAGALFAPLQGIVTPHSIGFQLSADLVIWTAVGGRFGLLGPVVGAVFIGFLAAGLRDHFRYWEIVVALLFIVVVLRLPGGFAGLLEASARRLGLVGGKPRGVERSIDVGRTGAVEHPELKFDGVTVRMGPVLILNDLSFAIDKPGNYCIIGPNGAGKTSTFNAMSGKLPAQSGRISWRGRALENTRPFVAAAHGVGRKLQVPSIFPGMTIGQNIDIALWSNRLKTSDLFSSSAYRWKTASLDEQVCYFRFLADEQTPAGRLSVGQRQMLDFAMTLLAEPDLVLLDEPCAGLSSVETEEMIQAIVALSVRTQAVFVIIEHDMQVVERLADHVIVMHQGALLASGTMLDIKSNAAVRNVYAGGSK